MQNQCILFSFCSRFPSYLNIRVILQGSAVTYLRCGRIYYMLVVGNCFLFQTVEEFGKSVKILQSYRLISSHLLFFKNLSNATVYKVHTHIDTIKCYDDKCIDICKNETGSHFLDHSVSYIQNISMASIGLLLDY